MKIIALVDPKDLRYVLTCERCAKMRDQKVNLMMMFFQDIISALTWGSYVRFKKNYYQQESGYKFCACAKAQIATYERERQYGKAV